jgi:ribonuclease T1
MSRRRQNSARARGSRPQSLSWGSIALILLALLIWWWSGGLPTSPDQTAAAPTVGSTAAETTQATPTTQPPATATAAPTAEEAADPTTAPTAEAASNPTAAPATEEAPAPLAMPQSAPAVGVSGLPTILYEELPIEAQETIQFIDQDGPFPFERDGITFQNRERLLPQKPRGYYREFTVITPGEDDRGARRIVAGEEGELYYTDDHYASFQEVIR